MNDSPEARPSQDAPARQFPCSGCGATVEFAPGTDSLECPWCGSETAIPAGGEVRELDYHARLAELRREAPREDHPRVPCGGCGALLDRPPELDAFDCPFCGRAIVATATSRRCVRPDSVLPFRVAREEARAASLRWIRSRWFAPSALARAARRLDPLEGVYQPAWTFDCASTTRYSGERGDAYHETVHSHTTVNGRRVTRSRRVRRVRWRPAAGTVHCRHDDVLVPAARSLPRELQDALEPWDLSALVPYRDEYLAGFVTEGYTVDLEAGFEQARLRMQPVIRAAIQRDIGGDEQRIHDQDSRYDEVTFKHLLLPLWISAYRFRERTYRVLVNARTGEVTGERPWSAWKVAGAVLLGLGAVGLVLFLRSR